MAKNNKKSTSQALLDLDEINAKLKEETKNTLKSLLAEAVKDGLNDAIEDEDDDEEEYTISDSADESDASDDKDVEEPADDEEPKEEETPAEEPAEEEGDDESDSDEPENDEWSEFDKYKDEDGDYDFSGEEGEEADAAIAKVYKLLKDSDQVVIKKEGNRAELKDNETGTEYIIDFGEDSKEAPEIEKVDDGDDMGAEQLQEWNGSDEIEASEKYPEKDWEVPEDDDENEDDEEDDTLYRDDDDEVRGGMCENKNAKTRKTMKENKEKVLFEVDLGYTDNYQDKDPIEGLSASEPAKNKNDWDEGVPADTKKPWAGETKSKGKPFEKTVNEGEEIADVTPDIPDETAVEGDEASIEEQVVLGSEANNRKQVKSACKRQEKKGFKKVSKGGKYEGDINEATKKQLDKLMAENKALKSAAIALKKNLQEALLVNVNLGKVVKLLQENSTTKAEKLDIVNRFDNVKSFDESNALYESISKELSNVNSSRNAMLEEKQITAAGSQKLNESKVYENPELLKIRNMMSRIDKTR